MNILGISGWKDLHRYFPKTKTLPLHDAAAALIVDGRIIGLAEEERFTRQKHGYDSFPVNASLYCLAESGLSLNDINAIGIYWDMPLSARLKSESWDTSTQELSEIIFPRKQFGKSKNPAIEFVNHHFAHALSAYSCSNFDNAVVLVLDGQGESASTSSV